AVIGEGLVDGVVGEAHGRRVRGLARGRELREADALQVRLLPLEAAAAAHLVVQVVGRDGPGVVDAAPDRARVEVAQRLRARAGPGGGTGNRGGSRVSSSALVGRVPRSSTGPSERPKSSTIVPADAGRSLGSFARPRLSTAAACGGAAGQCSVRSAGGPLTI